MKILTIIGARPQIIKAAAVSRAVQNHYPDQIEEFILHTGQHYDNNMSQVFFDQLGIPQPHYNLGVGSDSHGRQTARMIDGIEEVLRSSSSMATPTPPLQGPWRPRKYTSPSSISKPASAPSTWPCPKR